MQPDGAEGAVVVAPVGHEGRGPVGTHGQKAQPACSAARLVRGEAHDGLAPRVPGWHGRHGQEGVVAQHGREQRQIVGLPRLHVAREQPRTMRKSRTIVSAEMP